MFLLFYLFYEVSATVRRFLPEWVGMKKNVEMTFLVATLAWMPPLSKGMFLIQLKRKTIG